MAVIYARISQDRDAQSIKVAEQEKLCRALAESLGLTVDHVYVDNDTSATSGVQRPQFDMMLRSRPDAIITWHQDRLLRVTRDLERVIDLGVNVYFVVAGTVDLSTPTGRAVARTVTAWSTFETEHKAERQRAANRRRAEAGIYQFSRRPYGYARVGQSIEIVESEAEIVREGYRRYLSGESYYSICNDWIERGVPTFSGPWSMARVRSMLRNPAYAGERWYKGEFIGQGNWEPIVDRDTWDAYMRMRSRRKRSGDWSTQAKHLLSGIIFCGVCGAPMLARPDHGRQVYACHTNWCVSRSAPPLERYVERIVITRLQDPKVIERLRDTPDTAPMEAELATLQQRRDDLAGMLAEGLLGRDAVRDQASTLTTRIDALSGRLAALRTDSPLTDLALSRSVPERWEALSLTAKRRVIQEAGLIVKVDKGQPGIRTFDPDLIRVEWA